MQKSTLWWLFLTGLLSLFVSACSGGEGTQDITCESLADCPDGQRCNSNGVCSSQSQSCESSAACGFDEYCAAGTCQPSACEVDEQCAAGNVCRHNVCREGCRSTDECATGEVCNELTALCEPAGCTPTSCRSRLQRCDDSLSPPACVYTGACDTDVQCLAYAAQVGDGNEYICNTARGECVVRPPCGSDDDCAIGNICEPSGDGTNKCRPGCRTNDQCRIGETCAHDEGSVCLRGCASDDECVIDGDPREHVCRNLQCVPTCNTVDNCAITGQVCTGTPRICQGCTDDAQCRSGQFCDFELGSNPDEVADSRIGLCADVPPACPDDGFGNNHAIDRAHVVTTLPFDENPYFCRSNTGGDWYEIEAHSGSYIEVELEYDAGDGNLDLALLRADGTPVVVSAYPPDVDGGRETIRYGVDLGARYLVQVRGSIVPTNTRYDLKINVGAPPVCGEDAQDPNTFEEPTALEAGTVYRDLQVCGNAPDFYRLSIADNQVVRITAQAPANLGYITLTLRDEEGNQIAQASENQSAETIFFSTQAARDVILEVSVVNNVGRVEYELEWTQRDNACSDAFEPNNSCEDAAALAVGLHDSLAVCTDSDYYKITLLPFQKLSVRANYQPATAAGELDLFLFGPNDCLRLLTSGVEMPGQTSGTVAETLNFQAVRGGTYYLLANLFQGLNVPYSLEVDVEEGPPCVDDYAAGNDSPAEAYAINRDGVYDHTESALVGLRVCDLNKDWYKIDLEEGDEIRWHVTFRQIEGDIDIFLIGPDGTTVLDEGISETDDETVTYTVGEGEAGTYYLRVEGKYPVRANYRVLTYLNDVGPENALCPDMFGLNDARERAALVERGTYENLLVCGMPRNDDWFRTVVQAGETLTVTTNFDAAAGRVELRLYDDTGSSPVAISAVSNRNYQTVTYTSPRDQEMVYRVSTLSQVIANTYSMTVDIDSPAACVDDRFAGNHTRQDALDVDSPGLYSRLRMCENSPDWFAVELVAGQKFEAFIRFMHSQSDLDLFVWGPDPSSPGSYVVVGSAESTTNNESVVLTPAHSGTHYLEVRAKTPSRVDYDLLLFRDTNGDGTLEGPEDRLCPDIYEQNDSRDTARAIAPGLHEDLLLCWGSPNDEDWYSIYVPADATLTVDLAFDHSLGDIDMWMYRGNDSARAGESLSTTDEESITVTNTGLGAEYQIRVFGKRGTMRNYYTMEVTLEFAGTCTDPGVAGLIQADAKTLATGAHANLALCEATEHWYKFDLTAGERAHVELELNQRMGHIDVELIDDTGQLVASDVRSSNTKTIDTAVALSGTYYLRVFPRDDSFIRTSYDLWVSLAGTTPAQPYCPDVYERNDTPLLAAPLTLTSQRQYTDMLACGVDSDWYQVVLEPHEFELAAFFWQGEGVDLALEVQNSSGQTIASVNSTTSDEILTFTAPMLGTYFVGVHNNGTGVAPYSLHLVRSQLAYTPTAGATSCPEDAYEPNDNPVAARPLGNTAPLRLGLGACGSDDFFRWTAPESGTTTIHTRFNKARLNLGVIVSDSTNGTNVVYDLGLDEAKVNHAGGTFEAVAGRTYIIQVNRGYVGTATNPSNGPYFLHITQD